LTKTTLKIRLRGIWQTLSRVDARPGQIAAGFAIGIAAGFVPLNPSPIIVAAAVAWLLQRNTIAALAGAAVAILYTPLLPLMWLAEYRLGALLLPGQEPLTLDQARLLDLLRKGWSIYAAMFVGSIVIATPMAVLTYLIVKRLAERWARQKNPSGQPD
jgi:uncharacterized protein (DUF2062 family)